MKIKRLLCIVGKMDAGGAETFLMKIYRKIDREKYQLDFCIASQETGCYEKEILEKGGKIFHITSKTESFTKFTKELYNLLKTEKYERVLRIGADCFCAIDLWIAFFSGVKIRAFRSSNSGLTSNSIITKLHYLFRNILFLTTNVKIAPSDLAASFTFGKRAVKKNKVVFLHNGIDYGEYQFNVENRNKIRKEFNISDEFLIGHIGRFDIQKNHQFLLKLFLEMSKKYSNLKLLLIGKGELESEIRSSVKEMGIEDKVIISGVRSDIPTVLSAIDLIVFPSLFEGMPNTIIEAQANGLKCIISDSITKEVDITGLVKFEPLDNIINWMVDIDDVIIDKKYERKNYQENYRNLGYEIESVVCKFLDIIFNQ